MSAVIEGLEADRLAAVKERDALRAEVERVEAEAASYRRVLVAVRDAMRATEQEPDGDDDPRRPLASLVWRTLRERDAGADLLAEVERLTKERDEAYDREAKAFDALAKEQIRAGMAEAENKRLRGLILDAEAGGDGWCPWCDRDEFEDHAPDCPAFSARGEVRR